MNFKEIKIQFPAPGEDHLYLFDDISMESVKTTIKELCTIHQSLSAIEDVNADKYKKYFNGLTVSPFNITLHLNTPGGGCYAGFSLCDTISEISNERVIDIHASGEVCSMGIPIMLSVPLEHRYASKNTTFMIHQVSGWACGKVADAEQDVEEMKRLHNRIWDIIAKNSKITKEQLTECYDHKKDWFIDAEEALELGLISKIV